jgi:hypothetical protein
MKIPEIRARLHELAEELDCPELHYLAEETRRRTPVKKARAKARKLTRGVRLEIMRVYIAHPDWSNRRIGAKVGVDGGRVSETLAGFRE